MGKFGVDVIFKESVVGLGLVWGCGVSQGGRRSLSSFGVTQSGRPWGYEGLGEGFGNGGWCTPSVSRGFGVPQVGEEVKVRGQQLCWALEALGLLGDQTHFGTFQILCYSNIPTFNQYSSINIAVVVFI